MWISFVAVLIPAVAGMELWSSTPAPYARIVQEAYPVGNSKLGAMVFGDPGKETLSLNIDSLWSGGPFESSNYTGGNPSESKYQYLPAIQAEIFRNGTGDLTPLAGSDAYYGSYQVLGNLTISLDEVDSGSVANYKRSLDLQNAVQTTQYDIDGQSVKTEVWCSYPAKVCVYHIESNSALPEISVHIANELLASNLTRSSCGSDYARLTGVTQLGPPLGMKFDSIVRLSRASKQQVQTSCNPRGGILTIQSGKATSVDLILGGDTNYDQKKGNAESNYSFKGEDPGPKVERLTSKAAARPAKQLRDEHIQDYTALAKTFSLNLPDTAGSAELEMSEMLDNYDIEIGDPYLESLLFEYGRYLLIGSSRPGTLPSNLLGKWSEGLTGPWSSDYHLDINLQMNYWHADITGLGDVQAALWDYLEDTWVPRGAETAKLLYGAPDGAYVVHDELNIFGHTGMKSDPSWANYPVAAAWMMQHVYDHFDYSQDLEWFRSQGYPLIKGVAIHWLSQIMEDGYFNDSSLVINNCNSPEHGPTTFGCAHSQQLLVQVFSYVLAAAEVGVETDNEFKNRVASALQRFDTGIHIGTWGEFKEWKLPDSYGLEVKNDTHRHLSHLVGWHPGSSVSGLAGGYSNKTIQDAVATALYSRGNGTGSDADAGWEKVWRSACWARLNNTVEADFELRFAVFENFVPSGLSMYAAHDPPFQIDANFGLTGAVLSMLAVDLAMPAAEDDVRTVVLGPAIPARWGHGSVEGMRLRGGGLVDFEWDGEGKVTKAVVRERTAALRVVNVAGEELTTV